MNSFVSLKSLLSNLSESTIFSSTVVPVEKGNQISADVIVNAIRETFKGKGIVSFPVDPRTVWSLPTEVVLPVPLSPAQSLSSNNSSGATDKLDPSLDPPVQAKARKRPPVVSVSDPSFLERPPTGSSAVGGTNNPFGEIGRSLASPGKSSVASSPKHGSVGSVVAAAAAVTGGHSHLSHLGQQQQQQQQQPPLTPGSDAIERIWAKDVSDAQCVLPKGLFDSLTSPQVATLGEDEHPIEGGPGNTLSGGAAFDHESTLFAKAAAPQHTHVAPALQPTPFSQFLVNQAQPSLDPATSARPSPKVDSTRASSSKDKGSLHHTPATPTSQAHAAAPTITVTAASSAASASAAPASAAPASAAAAAPAPKSVPASVPAAALTARTAAAATAAPVASVASVAPIAAAPMSPPHGPSSGAGVDGGAGGGLPASFVSSAANAAAASTDAPVFLTMRRSIPVPLPKATPDPMPTSPKAAVPSSHAMEPVLQEQEQASADQAQAHHTQAQALSQAQVLAAAAAAFPHYMHQPEPITRSSVSVHSTSSSSLRREDGAEVTTQGNRGRDHSQKQQQQQQQAAAAAVVSAAMPAMSASSSSSSSEPLVSPHGAGLGSSLGSSGGGNGNGGASKYTSLAEVTGRISKIARVQFGCRFLQQQLDEVTGAERQARVDIVYGELYPSALSHMVDPFGNYLMQKVLERCSDQQRLQLVLDAKPTLLSLALHTHGTRVVQKMIELMKLPEEITIIMAMLTSSVLDLARDPNGNHVIQCCLATFGPDKCQFIFDVITNPVTFANLSSHMNGCCILQRCIDRSTPSQQKALIAQVAKNALTLVSDQFGNYVVQHVLTLRLPVCQEIIGKFFGHIAELAVHKYSSNVIEKCFAAAEGPLRVQLVHEVSDPSTLFTLIHDQFGNYVVQKALQASDKKQNDNLISLIKPHLNNLQNLPFAKRLVERVAKDLGIEVKIPSNNNNNSNNSSNSNNKKNSNNNNNNNNNNRGRNTAKGH